MNCHREVRTKIALAAALLLITAQFAVAVPADYPSHAIKIIVPLPPGAAADTLPRIIADRLSARWKQPVIIENHPGAASNLGAEIVAKANPDGYTLLATPPGPLVISQSFYKKLPFDPTAFVPVSVIATLPSVLLVNPKVPASTLQELIAYAKANPDKLNYASAGIGSPPHLAVEMFMAAAKIRLVHVPYKGLAPALTDLLAGRVDLMIDNLSNALPEIKAGKVIALAVGSEKRIPELANVPAFSETFPGLILTTWFAIVAPPKTPSSVAAELSSAIAETLQLPDVRGRFRLLSSTPVGSSPAEAATLFEKEAQHWHQVIVSAGISPR